MKTNSCRLPNSCAQTIFCKKKLWDKTKEITLLKIQNSKFLVCLRLIENNHKQNIT